MVFTGLLLCRLICFPTLCCSDYDDFPDFVLRRLWWFFPTLCCADYDDFPDFVRRRLWWYFPDFVLRRLWWFSPTLCCADNDRIWPNLFCADNDDFSWLCAAPTMMIFPTLCCADYDVFPDFVLRRLWCLVIFNDFLLWRLCWYLPTFCGALTRYFSCINKSERFINLIRESESVT